MQSIAAGFGGIGLHQLVEQLRQQRRIAKFPQGPRSGFPQRMVWMLKRLA